MNFRVKIITLLLVSSCFSFYVANCIDPRWDYQLTCPKDYSKEMIEKNEMLCKQCEYAIRGDEVGYDLCRENCFDNGYFFDCTNMANSHQTDTPIEI